MTRPIRHPFIRVLRMGGLFVIVGVLFIVGAYTYVHGAGNFHEVEKGVLYRSSRLGEEGLEKAVSSHGVKSVLNLCGEQPGKVWYDGETKVARRQGIVYHNLALSANKELDAQQVAELVEFLRDAPKPLLIHCQAGSDRTGLACAIFIASRGGSYRNACDQLSLYYGHFPYLGSRSVAMDITLRRFYESGAGRREESQAEAR